MNTSIKTFSIVATLLAFTVLAFWGLGDALVPLLTSFVLSYLVFPIVMRLENKGIERNYAVLGVFTIMIIFSIVTLSLIAPSLISDGKSFLNELPASSAKAIHKLEVMANNFGYQLDISKETIVKFIKGHLSEFSTSILKSITTGIKTSFSSLASWIIAILNIFLVPLFFFYVINDYEKISEEIRSYIPKSIQPKLSHYYEISNNVLSGYIRGQLMVALALAVLYALGLYFVGLRFGIIIGLLSGLISIIPYAGLTIGFITAMTMALANYSGLTQILGVAFVFIIVQTLEGFIITPKLVGNKVGLSALATMLALIIGGNLFGLVGMLIAIPLAAIAKTLILDLKTEYQNLEFYKK